jgi:hypothetical protein
MYVGLVTKHTEDFVGVYVLLRQVTPPPPQTMLPPQLFRSIIQHSAAELTSYARGGYSPLKHIRRNQHPTLLHVL